MKKIFRSFQLMLLDPSGNKTVRSFRIRPALLLLIVLMLLPGAAWMIWFYTPKSISTVPSRYYQLQRTNQDFTEKLAEAQGEISLRDAQINSLKAELKNARTRAESMQQRIQTYVSILEARKAVGVRILRAGASWKAPNELGYDITLVKGGNYPRQVSGKLRMVAHDSAGHRLTLQLGGEVPELPYRMESHTFLRGIYPWNADWRPDHLLIIRLNQRGRERDQIDIEIRG